MEERIRTALNELRSRLQADGGDLELESVEGSTVKLRLQGACSGCPHAAITLKQGIEQALKESVDPSITVERVD